MEHAGPLDPRRSISCNWGSPSPAKTEGAVRSHARPALEVGVTVEELRHVVLLAISTSGFPTAMASSSWINEVIDHRD